MLAYLTITVYNNYGNTNRIADYRRMGGANLHPVLNKNVRLQMDQGRGKKGTVSIVTTFRQSGCLRSLSVVS